ncbi:MAG: hypothetical protein ABS81_24010 [Pseudonocardia sp. SCN 72-86]|nr:MAG: hypothetical protein ABS81_24010 [Pseudonocardia sp. SCN 72-86]
MHEPAQGPDASLVAMVINQAVPRVATRADARQSFLQTSKILRGIGQTYGLDLDLVVLPEHGMLGAPQTTSIDEPLAFADEALDLLAPVCREVGIWAAISLSGGATRNDPFQQMALIDDRGNVVARHSTDSRSQRACAPFRTAVGPNGLRTALVYGDRARPFLADQDLWGAELVIQYWAEPGTSASQVVQSARSLAWSNTCFVISANAAGTDGNHHWAGYSSLVSFDGSLLGLCGDLEYEVQFAELPIGDLRAERRQRAHSARSVADTFRSHSSLRSQSVHSAAIAKGSAVDV